MKNLKYLLITLMLSAFAGVGFGQSNAISNHTSGYIVGFIPSTNPADFSAAGTMHIPTTGYEGYVTITRKSGLKYGIQQDYIIVHKTDYLRKTVWTLAIEASATPDISFDSDDATGDVYLAFTVDAKLNIVKIDPNGTVVFTNYYENSLPAKTKVLYINGDTYVSTISIGTDTDMDTYLITIKDNGGTMLATKFNNPIDENAVTMTELINGNLLLVYSAKNDPSHEGRIYWLEIDPKYGTTSGNWKYISKSISTSPDPFYVTDVIEHDTIGYLISGYAEDNAGVKTGLFVRLDNNLDYSWMESYPNYESINALNQSGSTVHAAGIRSNGKAHLIDLDFLTAQTDFTSELELGLPGAQSSLLISIPYSFDYGTYNNPMMSAESGPLNQFPLFSLDPLMTPRCSLINANNSAPTAVTGLSTGTHQASPINVQYGTWPVTKEFITTTDTDVCLSICSLTGITTNVTQLNCLGNNGEIVITTSTPSPTGAYWFIWSNGETTSTITNLASGTYDVSITDGICFSALSFTINATPAATWHKTTDNASNSDKTIKVLTDPVTKDVYVLGEFIGVTEVDGTLISGGSSQSGIFVVKYDECGTEQWIVHSSSTYSIIIKGLDLQFSGTKVVVYGKFDSQGPYDFDMVSSKQPSLPTQTVPANLQTKEVFSVDINQLDGDLTTSASTYPLVYSDIIHQVIYNPANNHSYFAGQFTTGGSAKAGVAKFTGTTFTNHPILDNASNNVVTAMILNGSNIYATANITNTANFGIGNINVNGSQEAVILLSNGTTVINMKAANATNFVSANDLVLESNGTLWMALQVNGGISNWSPWGTSFKNAMVVNISTSFTAIESTFLQPSNSTLNEASAEKLSIMNNDLYVAGTFNGGYLVIGNPGVGYTNPSVVVGTGWSNDLWMAKYRLSQNSFSWVQGSYSTEDVTVTDISYDGNYAFMTGAYMDDFDFQGMQTGLTHPNAWGPEHGYIIRGSDLATAGVHGQFYKTDQSQNTFEGNKDILEMGNTLSVFPNPSNGSFDVRLASQLEGQVQLFVYDLSGKLVFSQKLQKTGNIFEHSVALEQLESGMYLLELEIQNTTQYHKLLIK